MVLVGKAAALRGFRMLPVRAANREGLKAGRDRKPPGGEVEIQMSQFGRVDSNGLVLLVSGAEPFRELECEKAGKGDHREREVGFQ